MRTGQWITLVGSIAAALALFACSSTDSGGGTVVAKGGSGGSVVGKGGGSQGGSGGTTAEGGSSTGGTSQGGTGQGGSGEGGSSVGGTGGGAQGGTAGGGTGGAGGAPAGCATGETCEDVSGGKGTDFACIPADPKSMMACTDGPFGTGCEADQLCAFVDDTTNVCVLKDQKIPPTAKDCSAPTDCTAPDQCFGSGTTGKCLKTGCKSASCDDPKIEIIFSDKTTGVVSFCGCASVCTK